MLETSSLSAAVAVDGLQEAKIKSVVGRIAVLALMSTLLVSQPVPFSMDTPWNTIWNWLPIVSGPWFQCLLASLVVAFAGVFPLLLFNADSWTSDQREPRSPQGKATGAPNAFLYFAAGSLLGDVFLHLLPESWHVLQGMYPEWNPRDALTWLGVWVLVGMLSFVTLEKILKMTSLEEEQPTRVECPTCENHCFHQRSPMLAAEDYEKKFTAPDSVHCKKDVTGYLNLLANGVDNFAHGLAVGGSFLAGTRVGVLTTLAILIHEIPHEVGDFAILLRAGFTRWEATKGQLATAAVGLCGSFSALAMASDARDRTWWILPFTAGGFLSVALVNVLPDLLQSTDRIEGPGGWRKSVVTEIRNMSALFIGIGLMGVLALLQFD